MLYALLKGSLSQRSQRFTPLLFFWVPGGPIDTSVEMGEFCTLMFFRRPSCFKVCQPKLRPAISPVDMSLIQWAGFQVTAEDFTSALGHTGRSKGNLIQGRTILRKSCWKGDPWDTRPERTRAQTLQVALLVYPYPLKNGIWGGGVVLKFHFKIPF